MNPLLTEDDQSKACGRGLYPFNFELRITNYELFGHRQFKHPTKVGTVTVAGKPSKDLAPGTVNNIWKQAQLEGEQ